MSKAPTFTINKTLNGRELKVITTALPPTLPEITPLGGLVVDFNRSTEINCNTADGNFHYTLSSGTECVEWFKLGKRVEVSLTGTEDPALLIQWLAKEMLHTCPDIEGAIFEFNSGPAFQVTAADLAQAQVEL